MPAVVETGDALVEPGVPVRLGILERAPACSVSSSSSRIVLPAGSLLQACDSRAARLAWIIFLSLSNSMYSTGTASSEATRRACMASAALRPAAAWRARLASSKQNRPINVEPAAAEAITARLGPLL